MPGSDRRLVVVLIRPSRYDDEGYVVRHWRGTLPSNTLSCLHSLTEDAARSGELGAVDLRVEVFDEVVSRVDSRSIVRRTRRGGATVVVGLVGVQTNQFPRAQDLARQFRAEGVAVIVGGFHASGAMAMSPATPPECQAMLDAGVTLVLGEVEGRWGGILRDAMAGRLQPVYDFLGSPPDLAAVPVPRASRRTQRKFVLAQSGTIDAGRGCPFSCSFCTIVNVQGRTMRGRSAAHVLDRIHRNYRLEGRRGIRHYFFTDDNFARNPQWEAIFDGLIRMRQQEGADIDFMMQVDTQAPRLRGFVEKAARAGCVQVFIGMESVHDDDLKAGGKPQNKVADYREMIARWHAVGVVCHVGFIIGFPHDTYRRVLEDVRGLREAMLVDQASFFMLTPLPGSRDHQAAVDSGLALDPDYNNYDAAHATTTHPRMSKDEWERAFRDAWTEFYSVEHMRASLLAQNPHTYWAVLKNLLWYRAAILEGTHPMVTGFFRLKDRRSRRPTFPIERRWPFYRRRASEVAHVLRGYLGLVYEMQELWLATRIRRGDYWFLGDLRRLGPRSVQSVKLAWGRVHAAIAVRVAPDPPGAGPARGWLSQTMAERIDTVRASLERNAAGRHRAMAGAPDGPAESDIGPAASAGPAAVAGPIANRRRAWPALGDLRIPGLPPVAPPSSWLWRVKRANPLSLEGLESDPALGAYWRRTRQAWVRLKVWRLNPLTLAWNLARGTRRTLFFLAALRGERY
jgi:radical SAM superfamily enzyme YgiQ (UPF0313 family)